MWNSDWLRNRSFWLEAGLFLFIILSMLAVALVKPALPATSVTTTPTTSPAALTFYYSETDTTNSITKIWQSTTADVNTRSEIAVFNQSSGNPANGRLSPDGTQIALLIPAQDAVDITNGALWLLYTDGTYFQKATDESCSWFAWRQDSQALALFSQNTISEPTGQSVRIQNKLNKLNLSSGEISVILDEDSSMDVKPLGWSTGGDEFVIMTLSNTGKWSVSSILLERNSQIVRFSLPDNDLLRNAWLSPSGAYLIMDIIRNEKASLMLFSLDGRQQVEITSQGVGRFSNPTSFSAIWSPDGQHILTNQPSSSISNTTWKTYDLQGGAGNPVFLGEVDPNHYLRPLDWSPDGKWLVMAELPFPYAHLYIKEISAADRLLLPLEKPENRATWLGWSPVY